jgi:hypothetical protein
MMNHEDHKAHKGQADILCVLNSSQPEFATAVERFAEAAGFVTGIASLTKST